MERSNITYILDTWCLKIIATKQGIPFIDLLTMCQPLSSVYHSYTLHHLILIKALKVGTITISNSEMN